MAITTTTKATTTFFDCDSIELNLVLEVKEGFDKREYLLNILIMHKQHCSQSATT